MNSPQPNPRSARSIREFFDELLDAASEDRGRKLAAFCEGDATLHRQLEEMLAVAERKRPSPLDRVEAALGATGDLFNGDSFDLDTFPIIDGYKLKEKLGEGGMGEVFVAEQTKPVRRKVALKIIKRGMATKDVVARFEAERQALALMSHANIAKVLDGGTTEDGRPYFVMELVRGIPITDFCDERQFTTRERLSLFAKVCRAVQHAHQKGIIHRDLKPSNVMVELHDVEAVPKVIDFGIAKATNQQLVEQSVYTKYSQLIGTPLYMSPEQAELSGLDVDTRSDVYSLGVMLYELLTGTTPFDSATLNSVGLDEMRRMVREEDPPRPSQRISTLDQAQASTISTKRRSDPRELSFSMQREVDWIVMKALEKDRTRRYESASAFAQDIERHLEDEPVEACPPTLAYRLQKYTRRHRAGLITGGLVATSLIVGTAVSWWQAAEATRQRNRATAAELQAKSEAEAAKEINAFLTEDLLAQANPDNTPDPDVTLRTVLERASESVNDRFAEQPLVEAAIRNTLAETFLSLTMHEEAERHAGRALELYLAARGPDHVDSLQADFLEARVLLAKGEFDDADDRLKELSDRARHNSDVPSDFAVELLRVQGNVAWYLGEVERAEQLLVEVRERTKADHGTDNPRYIRSGFMLGNIFQRQGRVDSAKGILEECLAKSRQVLGEQDSMHLDVMQALGGVYRQLGRSDEAKQLMQESLAIRERTFGKDHLSTQTSRMNLASTLNERGEFEEAEYHSRIATEGLRGSVKENHQFAIAAKRILARAIYEQGRVEEALSQLTQLAERTDMASQPGERAQLLSDLANMNAREGRLKAAQELLEDAVTLRRQTFGDDHPSVFQTLADLAEVEIHRDAYDEASLHAVEAIEGMHRALHAQAYEVSSDHPTFLSRIDTLTNVVWRLATRAEPGSYPAQRNVTLARTIRDILPDAPNNWSNLGVALLNNEQYEEAVAALEQADEMQEGGDLEHRMFFAIALWEVGDLEAARRQYVEGVHWIANERPNSNGQKRFRARAEEVMGINAEERERILAESSDEKASPAQAS